MVRIVAQPTSPNFLFSLCLFAEVPVKAHVTSTYRHIGDREPTFEHLMLAGRMFGCLSDSQTFSSRLGIDAVSMVSYFNLQSLLIEIT